MTARFIAFFLLLLGVTSYAADPAVVDLSDVSPLREWFQRETGNVRVIALLSPSCMSCIKGFEELQNTLKSVGSSNVRLAIVWLPIGTETRQSAVSRSSGFVDGRVTYFWDPYRAAGETWQSVLKLKGAAWDVYMLYGPSSAWNEPDLDPAPPAFWMHQLKEVPQAPTFDRKVFETKLRSLL